MPKPEQHNKPNRKATPILVRHAISLAVVFVLGLVLSYYAGQLIHQKLKLNQLSSSDQATFDAGLGYVVTHAGDSEAVTDAALEAVQTIDPQRAANLLLAVAQSHADLEEPADPIIPARVSDAVAPLMQRLDAMQAIGLYDGLVQIKGIDPVEAAKHLLAGLSPKDDAELLQVVDLLDTRLLWSKQWAPLDLWVRWLGLLAKSNAELTQFNTAKRIGELPDAADDPRIVEALTTLAGSGFDSVRAAVLNAAAGYAALAKAPTDYEQIIFTLGQDKNKIIARRAWMVVGHLNPLSGFAVNWQDADPFIAEAMLWAAVKTNPENPKPALQALNENHLSSKAILALSQSREVSWEDIAYSNLIDGQSDFSHAVHRMNIQSQSDALAIWRGWLALDPQGGDIEVWYVELNEDLNRTPGAFMFADDMYQIAKNYENAYYLVAVYRLNNPYTPKDRQLSESVRNAASLAAIEGRFLAPFPQKGITDYEPSDLFPALIAAVYGQATLPLEYLIGTLPLDNPILLDIFTLALTHADNDVIDRFMRSAHPQMVTMAAIASVIKNYRPKLIKGVTANFFRKHPDLTNEQLRAMTDSELSELGLSKIDALPALLEAAEAAPLSANREVEAKLLKLALWMRGDLGDDFTPTAEAMLFDQALPTSTVLLCLLHMQRPAALDYLFGDLATPRPDLHKLFIQERYWHVFRRFVDTSDLTLWLWGDPEAQAFQLEAMQQWYAVNRWKIERGDWPAPQ